MLAGLRFVGGETPPRVTLQPAQANINILDDDGENLPLHSTVNTEFATFLRIVCFQVWRRCEWFYKLPY